ncbi:MAG: hypothetical protein J4F34_09265 [Gemmatimonadetes bacterium]|nr:hypothetical protein [Gemmatimonadota bacterium]
MKSSSFPGEPDIPVVTDASVIINLNATRTAAAVINGFPNRFLVTDTVRGELLTGGPRGHQSWEELEALIRNGSIELVELDPDDGPVYRSLVEGGFRETLDDGEAATIAHAVVRGAVALIDERKARRICADRFPALRLASTVDVLCHGLVKRALGESGQRDVVFRALRDARMQVVPRDRLREVVELIGADRAAKCPSLPRWARTMRGA